jgi:hypothetical protein
VRRSELKAADVVFFRIEKKDSLPHKEETEMHVGLYTEDGRFVHAPSTGKVVREDLLSNNYWARRYAMGRRVLGSTQAQAPDPTYVVGITPSLERVSGTPLSFPWD